MDAGIWVFWVGTAWLMADFVTAVIHWWEDRYGNPDWPVLGPLVVRPNIRHHVDQRAFLAGNYWQRNWTTIVPSAVVAAGMYLAGQPWWALVAVFASQANEIHGWAHQKCNRLIRGLQLLCLLSSPEDHAEHHEQPFNTDFCVMTGILNSGLELVAFWRTLETLIGKLTGIWPRSEREQA